MTGIGRPLGAFFEAEVERLLDRLYGSALRLTRNPADAEDLVADTLAKAWAGLDELKDRQAFERWVFRILVNSFISECRKRRARPREVAAETTCGEDSFSLFEKVHQPFLLWWGSPERELLDKLLREDIESAVEELPEEFRIVVIMADLCGLSYAETADTLDIPLGTVRSRLSRGRSLLQGALWRQAGEVGIAVCNAKGGTR